MGHEVLERHTFNHTFAGKSNTVTRCGFHFLRTRFAKAKTRIWSVKSTLEAVGQNTGKFRTSNYQGPAAEHSSM